MRRPLRRFLDIVVYVPFSKNDSSVQPSVTSKFSFVPEVHNYRFAYSVIVHLLLLTHSDLGVHRRKYTTVSLCVWEIPFYLSYEDPT